MVQNVEVARGDLLTQDNNFSLSLFISIDCGGNTKILQLWF